MPTRPYTLNSRGDTIIEVLLAIAVVTSLLGGAYISANRSLNTTQVSKERDVALRVAETQLERIRAYRSINTSPIATDSCINSSLVVVANPASGGPVPLASDPLNNTQYAPGCSVDSSSTTYTAGVEDITYYIYNKFNAADSVYTIYVRWLRSRGGENQETIMRYRAY